LVVDGKIAAVGHGLLKEKEHGGKAASKVEATGLHVTPGLVDCHNHSMVLGAVNEGTLPSTAMVRIGDVVNSESVNVHRQLANRFTAAQQYLNEWADYRNATNKVAQASSLSAGQTGQMPVPPRRNLELEAIGEILQGKRWVHCHSYRQDEILSFLRAMDSFGV